MARQRQCILCETVHNSQQEMREHMRSMLHHRELEKLKGRDCGHECRVCKVTVVSLTDYASHISSPIHKQKVEAEQKHAGNNHEDCSFDKELVELVEKRKEQIRKEKEAAAAAKLAKEEAERRRKEEFQQRLKEAKDHYQMDYTWKQQSQRFGGSGQHNSWYGGNRYNGRSGKQWHYYKNRQGKSATWHAQEPPNFQNWASEEFVGGNMHIQGGWNDRQWAQDGPFGNQQCRLPWISSGGSSNGIYGHNNIPQYQERGRPLSFTGPSTSYPSPPSLFQNGANEQGGQQGRRLQDGGGNSAESDHNSSKSSKNFGSNSKLDKSCRWSPYPVTKGSETVPHKETKAKSSEKYNPKVSKTQKQSKTPETTSAFNRSRPEQKPGSSSRSSSAQREDRQNPASAPSSKKVNKQLQHKDKKMTSSSSLSFRDQLSKALSAGQAQSKQTAKQSGLSSQAPDIRPLKLKQGRQLPEAFQKIRQTVLEKRGSLEGAFNNRMETSQQNEEEQQSLTGVNKENSCGQNATIPKNQTDSVRPQKADLQSSDSSQFLQSLQVSTSTAESSEPAASKQGDENMKKSEKQSCSVSTEEAMQAVEAGQGSESDTSKSGEAQISLSNTSLAKLDLQSVLRRDLTKHISLKNKTGSHEPNLNIARRVRNLSESRRSDTEKESGLKPTVRQLISSSGSRRNVNWEQVYQEVRKKQDKGKGMPRFGIEMVPNEQEDQSQEENNIALLEGFHWDSLMDFSPPAATRKRSLSESSLAPESTPTMFTSLMSEELAQKEVCNSAQHQGSSVPPIFRDNKEHRQQEVDHLLAQSEVKAEKQPDKLSSAVVTVKTLQRSDSALGDSSSGAEQIDGQGTGKRRRAAGDAPSTETSCLEHNNKRQKVKTKDRLQIDQLLAVSLREEELSHSLQTVDTSLIQARAALEAAYMEVQRLMVVKQQMTVEMSTLRNKRIELLKGMQGTLEEEPQVKLKEEKMDFLDTDPNILSPVISKMSAVAAALSPSRPSHCASPPSSSPPLMSVVIKQEPQSPLFVSSELDPEDNITHCAHSTTPELPVAPAAAAPPPDPALNLQPSFERNAELYQANTDCKLTETTEKAAQATRNCLTPMTDSKTPVKLLLASRRSSEVGSAVDCASTKSFEPPPVPASPPDLSNGKRVRKLKKRKALKKAQGTEQPESSDTEIDREPQRPRWLRTRRRPSGGSQVTTSSLPAEDREGDMSVENSEGARRQLSPTVRLEQTDHHASKQMPNLILNLDSEENMEVTAVCQQQHVDALVPASTPVHSSKPGLQSLACNEVTSTSDIDICKSTESDMLFSNTVPQTIKISSDVSSDHSVDAMPTEGAFEGHQEAVNAMQIHDGLLYTCSGDRTVRVFDLVSHKCVGVFEGHSSKVSCLLVSAAPSLHHRLYSGSSDQTIRCYSLKTQEFEQQFSVSDRVLCLHSRWRTLYAGLANGTVVTFNLKTNKQMDVFECRGPRAVSCLASSQEGARRILLVGSYDRTISVRDAKNGLLLRTLEGHTKTVLCMKVVNDLVFSGSSDQCVHAHNIHTGELVRVYKGHSHAVTVVNVLGKVMVTACLDKLVRVFDLQSHEQLQVYGGHEDMVMCMAVHKNMIYTGCYDGSVQAVKLNLMQSYRCWWHGCSLLFGVMDHLKQHLIKDHTSANIQTLKCRWRNCEELLCSRNSSKEGVLLHMHKHAEEETDVEP